MNPLDQVSRARLPSSVMAAMAGLRRIPGISIVDDDELAWVTWDAGDDRILRALLPIEGVELYESREGQWFRPGQSLPSFDEAPNRPPIGLDRAIVPLAFSSLPPPTDEPQPMELRLVADAKPRATTATLCAFGRLAEWADRATSAEIGAIRAAVTDELALLIGPGLPFLADSGRYWGDQLLVPLGFSPWPVLPEGVIRQAIGANEGHLALLNGEGRKMTVEIIPFESFRPMTRAGVRLAMKGRRHES